MLAVIVESEASDFTHSAVCYDTGGKALDEHERTPKKIHSGRHHGDPQSAGNKTQQYSGISRTLCEQRAGTRECVGLLSRVRHVAAAERTRSGGPEFSRHLLQPATGKGADEDPGAE